MTVKNLIAELNQKLEVLAGKRYNPENTTDVLFHDDIKDVLMAYFEEHNIPVEVGIWRLGFKESVHAEQPKMYMPYEIMQYDVDFTKDKRCAYKMKGVLNKAWIKIAPAQANEEFLNTKVADLPKYFAKLYHEKAISAIESRMQELQAEMAKLEADLAESKKLYAEM